MKYAVKPVVLILCVSLGGVRANAQQKTFLEGMVIDVTTKAPIPFATIKLKKYAMGVVSNVGGDFQIPLRYKALDDSIAISCIGYRTTSFSLKSLDENGVNVLELRSHATLLAGIIVRAPGRSRTNRLSPERVLALAIKNIELNYPQDPFAYIGYYRDYQLRDTSYLNLNEAIVEVYDKGFESNDQRETQIELLEYRTNTTFPRDTIAAAPYDNKPNQVGHGRNKYLPNAYLSSRGGNELSILRLHDAVRNNGIFSYSFVNTFSKDFVANHALKMQPMLSLDTVSLYCISFESRYSATGPRNFSKGKIYIEKKNFSIHKIEYATYNKTTRETQMMYEIVLEYARKDQRMYLNYISFNNAFRLNNDTNFKVIEIQFNKPLGAFVLDFNNVPDKVSVTDTSNYYFFLQEKPIRIVRTQMTGERRILLFPEPEVAKLLTRNGDLMASAFRFNVLNIRDVDNRPLDIHDNGFLFQFRELFVQQMFPGQRLPVSAAVVQKDRPLSASPAQPKPGTEFWMNTPLKK